MTARRAAVVAAAAVAVAVVAATLDWTVLHRAATALARDPVPLVVALAVYSLAFVLRAAAWAPLLPVAVPLGTRVRALFAMLAVNHALPGPVGELARARIVTQVDVLPFRRALMSVAAARLADASSLAALAVAGAWLAGEAPAWLRVAAPLALAAPVAAFVVARRRGTFVDGPRVARAAMFALPSWALECGVLYTVATAAGLRISLAGALLATCCGVLAQVAAVLPGGIGTYEAGVTSALVVLGVAAPAALAAAAATHAVKFLYAFAVGLPALGWEWPRARRFAARGATA